jgi:uncharacterized delta-60 repeat protein
MRPSQPKRCRAARNRVFTWSVCELFEPRHLLAAAPVGAALDTTFGNGGIVVTDSAPGSQTATDKAFDARSLPDGDFIIAGAGGNQSYDFGAVARYNSDGSLDTAFDQDGIALYDGGADAARANWHAAAPADGGKVVVAGDYYPRVSIDPPYNTVRPLLARYNANGSLDTVFGNAGDGTVRPPVDLNGDIWAIEPLPDGRILAAGVVYGSNGSNARAALWRFNAGGTPDATFGTGGRVTLDGPSTNGLQGLAVLGDGAIVAIGYDGVTFHSPDGTQRASFPGLAAAVAAQGADKVLVAASDANDDYVHVVRRMSDGSLDPSFPEAIVDLGGRAAPAALLTRPDGSVLVAARTFLSGVGQQAYLLRLRPDASRDADFSPGGAMFLFSEDSTNDAYLRRLLPAADGRVIAAGGATRYVAPGDFQAGGNFVAARVVIDPPGLFVGVNHEGTAIEGRTANVSAADSSYAGGSIARYEWDADYNGRDFTVDASGMTATVPVGDDKPARAVVLRVTTSDGLQVLSAPVPLVILNAPPAIDLNRVPAYAAYGVTTTVGGTVTDPGRDAVTLSLKFGDGDAPQPVIPNAAGAFSAGHAYARPGTYAVSVTATDDDGGTSTDEAAVHVVDVVGTVFRDADDDGTFDAGEPPMVGVTVYEDANGNGALDAGERQALTDATGVYFFEGLGNGSHALRVARVFGFRVTNAASGLTPVVVDDTHGAARNFGLTDRGRITGINFTDANLNGVRDAGESSVGAPGAPSMYLDLNNNGTLDRPLEPVGQFESGSGVTYLFRNLEPGTYTVRVDSTFAGTTVQTSPGPLGGWAGRTVTVSAGEVSTGNDFGFVQSSLRVSGVVYEDRDGNGTRTSAGSEPGIANFVVYLDADGDAALDADERRIRTDAGGGFSLPVIEGLPATVRTAPPAGWLVTQPAGDGAYVLTPDSDNPAALAGRNFGARQSVAPAVVGRSVFYAGGADEDVAPDKAALLPGQTATFANVTSFADGITGVVVDVRGLATRTFGELEAPLLFSFRRGGATGTPPAWQPTTLPRMTVLRGGGADGSDRVILRFDPATAVKNGWLEATVLANAYTGLSRPDVFYVGNLVGEAGDVRFPLRVNALDVAAVKRALNTSVGVGSPLDFNRDGRINALDVALVKQSLGHSLDALTAPATVAPAALAVKRVWREED